RVDGLGQRNCLDFNSQPRNVPKLVERNRRYAKASLAFGNNEPIRRKARQRLAQRAHGSTVSMRQIGEAQLHSRLQLAAQNVVAQAQIDRLRQSLRRLVRYEKLRRYGHFLQRVHLVTVTELRAGSSARFEDKLHLNTVARSFIAGHMLSQEE